MCDTKICSKCGDPKSFDLFPKTGCVCKYCTEKRRKEYRKNNKEKVCLQHKAYQDKNKEIIKIKRLQYRKDNSEKLKISKQKWNKNNKEKYLEQQKRCYYKNRNERILKVLQYAKDNPEKILVNCAKRRAIKLQAIPSWYELEKETIKQLYVERDDWVRYGVKAHVDHIVPLKHPLVCGLHTFANMRVISAGENLSKGNTFEVI